MDIEFHDGDIFIDGQKVGEVEEAHLRTDPVGQWLHDLVPKGLTILALGLRDRGIAGIALRTPQGDIEVSAEELEKRLDAEIQRRLEKSATQKGRGT